METLKSIARRKSTRSYKPEQITEKELAAILHAGCAAPVGMGAYESLHMTVLTNQSLMSKMIEATAKASGDPGMNPFYGAPTVVFISAKKSDFANVNFANAGCVIENMMLAATDLGLGSVYLMGFLRVISADPVLIAALELPEGYAPVSAVALGYPSEPLCQEKELKQTISMNIIK